MNIAGLRLPLRETVVALVTTFVLVIDYYHPLALLNLPIGPAASTGIARVGLFLLVPLVTLLLLGERPSAYGLRHRICEPVLSERQLSEAVVPAVESTQGVREALIVNAADFGVPQIRERYTR